MMTKTQNCSLALAMVAGRAAIKQPRTFMHPFFLCRMACRVLMTEGSFAGSSM
jgi:hypothetical protein